MKKAILVALCTLGLTGMASANTVVYHGYEEALGADLKIGNTCLTDTEARTIAPVQVCDELVEIAHPDLGEGGSAYSEWVCKSWSAQSVSVSRDFERTVCLAYGRSSEGENGDCLSFGKQADRLPDTIKISTVTTTYGEAGDNFPGVQSSYTFPRCN